MKYLPCVIAVALLANDACANDIVRVASVAAFENPDSISPAVRDECDLPRKQMEFLIAAAREKGIALEVSDEVSSSAAGKVLIVQIARADSVGRAGGNYHAKSVALRGKLLQDGKEIGSFVGMRNSTGQAFGVLKSSCVVLDLCLKRLANDVSAWLEKPTMNARIGE